MMPSNPNSPRFSSPKTPKKQGRRHAAGKDSYFTIIDYASPNAGRQAEDLYRAVEKRGGLRLKSAAPVV